MDTGRRPLGGLVGAELIGLRRWEMPGVDAKDPVWDRYRATLDARSSFRDFEFSYCGPDGQRFHASISGHPLYRPDGQFVGYRGTARDITAEVEAKEQAERTTALLDAVRQIQSSYIGDSDPKKSYEQMLATLLHVTQSAYGFVGEIRHDKTASRISRRTPSPTLPGTRRRGGSMRRMRPRAWNSAMSKRCSVRRSPAASR